MRRTAAGLRTAKDVDGMDLVQTWTLRQTQVGASAIQQLRREWSLTGTTPQHAWRIHSRREGERDPENADMVRTVR